MTAKSAGGPAATLAHFPGLRCLPWSSRLLTPGRTRLVRFAITGAVSGAAQLGILALLLRASVRAWPADVAAFAVASQVNFALSRWFTWGDRRHVGRFAGCWLRFMSTISLTALLNLGVFAVADRFVPSVLAAACGIAIAGGANFVISDRAVFRRHRPAPIPIYISTRGR